MFHFLKKYKHNNLEWIGVDVHSHLLPGLDDGAKTQADSILYLEGMQELGFKKIITTPHIFKELYPNNKEIIETALNNLKAVPEIQRLNIELEAAAEYMLNPDFDPLLMTRELLFWQGNHVLIEMSYIAESPRIEEYIFDLKIKGFQPVLAHPERYVFYHNDFNRYKRIKDLGCLMQLNVLSLVGYYGKEVKATALKLIKQELFDLIGTDLHHERHLQCLQEYVKKGTIWEIAGTYPFRNKEYLAG